MKKKIWFRNGLLFLLCVLLSACGTPDLPEQSSVPAEESSEEIVPAIEDPNAKVARAYLEEILDAEESVEWIPSGRVEAIRDCVKQLQAPILTEEDVLRIADRAAAFYCAALEEERAFSLPAYGPARAYMADPAAFIDYSDHANAYNALVAYTCYLFTPPDYVYRETELQGDSLAWSFGESPSFLEARVVLCLPLAELYTTSRLDALDSVCLNGRCILLYPQFLWNAEQPLDFQVFDTPVDLLTIGCTTLTLIERAENNASGRTLRLLYDRQTVNTYLDAIVSGKAQVWFASDGDWNNLGFYVPLESREARALREAADHLPEPLLSMTSVRALSGFFREITFKAWLSSSRDAPYILPDVDGTGDVVLDPDAMSQDERLRRAFAYTIDLFTPRAYRFTDQAGTRYELGGEDGGSVLVTAEYELFLIDWRGITEPLRVRTDGEGAAS